MTGEWPDVVTAMKAETARLNARARLCRRITLPVLLAAWVIVAAALTIARPGLLEWLFISCAFLLGAGSTWYFLTGLLGTVNGANHHDPAAGAAEATTEA